MRNPKLATLLLESVDENRKEKVCLIEDIRKIKRLLYGQGETHHDEFLSEDKAADLFFQLYDMDFIQLGLIYKSYEKTYNKIILTKMGMLV